MNAHFWLCKEKFQVGSGLPPQCRYLGGPGGGYMFLPVLITPTPIPKLTPSPKLEAPSAKKLRHINSLRGVVNTE